MPRARKPLKQKYGWITVLAETTKQGRRVAICRCECGVETLVVPASLLSGNTTSCGCKRKYTLSKLNKKHAESHPSTPEYRSWLAMHTRCNNPNAPSYDKYGGRGIKICAEWVADYSQFLADMGRKPTPKHTLDRINNDGPYSPENCRWSTISEQVRNRRVTVSIQTPSGVMPLAAAAELYRVKYDTLHNYNSKGKTIEDLLRKLGRV